MVGQTISHYRITEKRHGSEANRVKRRRATPGSFTTLDRSNLGMPSIVAWAVLDSSTT